MVENISGNESINPGKLKKHILEFKSFTSQFENKITLYKKVMMYIFLSVA